MLTNLVAALHSAKPDLTAEEIADALWLARYMQNAEAQSDGDESLMRPADASIAELIPARSKRKLPPMSAFRQVSSDLYLRTDQKEGESGSQMGSHFRSPAASALPHALDLGRALRPFKRRIPSRTAFVLDEEATAKQIAEVDLWLPVLNAALTRWLEIALVVDEGASMVIWRQTIAELRLLLEREGAFRDVRTWGLVTDASDGKTRLYAGTGWDLPNRRECRPNELIDPGGQRLILVVTDCVSRNWDRGWDDGSVPHLMTTWGRSCPVAIIQVLPQRLWMDTALNGALPVRLHIPSPGLPNRRLTIQPIHYWDKNEVSEGIAVPIVTLEPQSLLAWSRAVARAEDVWIPGYKFNTSTPMPVKDEENIDDLWRQEEEPVSAQDLIDRFRSTASPMAYRLAELLAAVPLSLPIIRLIQQTLLPESSQIHVAEVFLGGLLEEIPSEQDIVDPDYVEYDFIKDVRELLLASLTVGESLEALSTYVESHIGQARDFYTLLANPLAKEGVTIDKRTRTFASVSAKVLSGLGGEFAPLADWLQERLASEQQQASLDQLLDGHKRALDSTSETEQTEMNGLAVSEADNAPLEEQRQSVVYCSANVVVLGDTGVGKSGLSLVLADQPFVPTESTHGRKVWVLDSRETEINDRRKEIHEIQLWDLAGQPGYRLIHQLYLDDASIALIVFDARSETDPFAGVYYWDRALSQTQRVQGSSALPLKKILVQARVDRGGRSVGHERIQAIVKKCGFDGYFETSAKEGWHITDLQEAIRKAIDWERLPKTTSTDLFGRIRKFLVDEKTAGRLLVRVDDLYRIFLKTEQNPLHIDDLDAQFETCIGRVESQGLIRKLSFGNLILLQPEVLDIYLSSLINAVRGDPAGLGSIVEERAQVGDFFIPKEVCIVDRELEKLLLIAMIEDLLRYEIALREQRSDGSYLVFPSQFTRENTDLPEAGGKSVVFTFEGAVQNIYATLVVRLSHSELFNRKDLWKNAVTYTTKLGETYGIFLHNIGDGHAELTVFFDKVAREETCFHFEEYIRTHLERNSLLGTVKRRRIFVCSNCETPLTDIAVERRRKRGFDWITCPVCDTRVSLLDREERLAATPDLLVSAIDRAADNQRDREAAKLTLQGKAATMDFDVFLCHHGIDKPAVKKIGEQLKAEGLLPWLDEWELRPGLPWQRLLEEQIEHIKSAAVFVGKDGIGPWQQMELEAFLREFVLRGCPVIPVLLDYAPNKPQLPIFLRGMTWVDFRKSDPNSLENLLWGITGIRRMKP